LPWAGNSTNRSFKIPAWCNWLLIFQLCLVYFYAGVAKINSEWLLNAMPLKIWLPAHDNLPLIGPLLSYPETAYVFSWFGMIYDCSIPFLLINRRTRHFAYAAVVLFHLMTGILFQIGVFPLVMIGSTIIFFSAEWHHRFLAFVNRIPIAGSIFRIYDKQNEIPLKEYKMSGFLKWSLGLYILFQLLFPWRYLLYPGNLYATEQGYRFSWRVMLVEKSGDATFYIRDGNAGREGIVNNREFLNSHQEKQMSYQPDMILEFAHFIGNYYRSRGMKNPEVRAEVYVTINARPGKLLFDPKMDLMKIEDGLQHKTWIRL
ncbi:MAG: HTTM domain-containing protein, partial [Bacteroidetes bacterium]|nr:HTTM domain-containing protein [Bacteroidota bacterium]